MNKITLPEKELALIKTQTSKAIAAAQELEIKTPEDEGKAAELLAKIKQVGQIITEKRESITKPLNEALRNARAFFAPFEQQYTQAEQLVKGKLVQFRTVQMAKVEKKEHKIIQQVQAGEMDFKTAEEKLAETKLEKTIETPKAALQYRTVKEVIIENEAILPLEYLMPNMPRIKEDALKGKEIAGVKVIEKQIVARA